jgi:hypothetical protein
MWTKEDGTMDSDKYLEICEPLLEIMMINSVDDNSTFRKELSKKTK